MCRLCEFADVRNRAAQFFAFKEIFIALKQTFVNRHNRHVADIRVNDMLNYNKGAL